MGTEPAMNSKTDTARNPLDRILVLEMVRVTEAAAVAASKLIGRGDEKAADAAARDEHVDHATIIAAAVIIR